jgi:predicted MFS family arabinose efflux permease
VSGAVTRPRLRAVLARPGFRRLFAAQTISRWGDAFHTVALALLVFDLTGSGLGVSGVVLAEILPVLLVAPLAGAVVDRLPPRAVLVAADLWRMTLALALPFVADSVGAVYGVAFGLSLGAVFFNPASASAVPALVDERELIAANSGIWSAAVVSQIVLAPLAGVVVAAAGVTVAFLVNAATYALSAALLIGLRVPTAAGTGATGARLLARAREGIAVLARVPLLRLLAMVQLLAALSAGATSALLVVFAKEQLGVDARGYGLLLGAIGVGAAVGPLLLTRLTDDPRRPAFVFGPYLVRAVVDLVLAATRNLAVAVGALGVYGVGTSTGMVTYQSLLQAEVAPELRGRAFAGFDALWQLGRLVSLGIGGALADFVGIAAVYALGGLLLAAAGVLGLTGLRRFA